MSGQFADKPNRITQQKRRVRQHHFPDRCVESCKEFVFSKNIRFAEQIHECALAYVGISYQGDPNHIASILTTCLVLLINLFELFLEF